MTIMFLVTQEVTPEALGPNSSSGLVTQDRRIVSQRCQSDLISDKLAHVQSNSGSYLHLQRQKLAPFVKAQSAGAAGCTQHE